MDLIAEAGSISSADLAQKKAELKLKHKVGFQLSYSSLSYLQKLCSFI